LQASVAPALCRECHRLQQRLFGAAGIKARVLHDDRKSAVMTELSSVA
jgi:hypothetical protein